MNLKNLVLFLLLVFLGKGILSAQDASPPDLSGTWKLNLQKSKLPRTKNIQSEVLVIKCSGLSIEMSYATDGKESEHSYIADGKERTLREVQGGEVAVKARWKRGVLVVETEARLKMPDQPYVNGGSLIHTKDQWTLSSDGRSLSVESKDPKTTLFYDKLQASKSVQNREKVTKFQCEIGSGRHRWPCDRWPGGGAGGWPGGQ